MGLIIKIWLQNLDQIIWSYDLLQCVIFTQISQEQTSLKENSHIFPSFT